jgi:hypothetical protein
VDPNTLVSHYEAARARAVGDAMAGPPVLGLSVLYRWGLPAWMRLVQDASQHPDALATARTSPTVPARGADAAATILIFASMLLTRSMESSQCTPRPN